MKKLLIGLILFVPLFAKADTQLFYFMNGNGYDLTGQLQTYKLMDGSCYNVQGVQVDCLTDVPITPTSTSVTIVPIQNQVQNLPPQTVVVTPVQPVVLPTSTPATSTPVTPLVFPIQIFDGTPTTTPDASSSPVTYNIQETNLTNNEISFTWQTDKEAHAVLMELNNPWASKSAPYWENGYWDSDAYDDGLNHSGTYGRLQANTTYDIKFKAIDTYGNVGYSQDFTFTTLP